MNWKIKNSIKKQAVTLATRNKRRVRKIVPISEQKSVDYEVHGSMDFGNDTYDDYYDNVKHSGEF